MIITLAGIRAIAVELRIPQVGRWTADVDFDAATALPAGKLPLAIGAATFTGTVDERFSGTFLGVRKVHLVAGSNGWSDTLESRHFHNDAGLKDKIVLQATAEECGEVLSFNSTPARIGVDYIRQRGRAAAALLRLAGSGWYVDYQGVTQVGLRVVAKLGKFDLLEFDSRQNIATLGTNDAQAVGIGAVLTERLDKPLTVRDLTIRVNAEGARVLAWGTT